MNNILKISLTVFLFVIIYLSSLWSLPKPKIEYMDDKTLREYALSHGLAPTPTEYTQLLKVLDNPQNPMTKEKIELGKKLFFDPILSLDESISCASCHILKEGGDDNLPTAIGYHGLANPKHLNSPTVLNAALAKAQFWNASAKDVEAQAAGPMRAPFEMNITPKEAVKRVKQKYQAAFDNVFDGNVSFLNIQNAIGSYERTLLTRGAYDLFLEGDDMAMNESAKRGLNLFIQKGCKGCHTGMSVGGQSVQHFPLRRTLDSIFSNEPFPFENIGGFLGAENKKKFRVPILRNITKTAPYFHNGVVTELREAIRIMSKYQIADEFDEKQIDDMVEFFKSLEGELVSY
jgi:cytochrome c peroxidase